MSFANAQAQQIQTQAPDINVDPSSGFTITVYDDDGNPIQAQLAITSTGTNQTGMQTYTVTAPDGTQTQVPFFSVPLAQ